MSMSMAAPGQSLEARLQQAAVADNWRNIVHRCAWCERAFDERGAYLTVIALDSMMVATDGMCPACATSALAQIARRKSLAA